MIEVKNQFARHTLFWILLMPFLAIMLMPALMNAQSLKLPKSEVQALRQLGQDPADVTRKANAAFAELFVNTGFMTGVEKLFRAKANHGDPASVRNSERISQGYLTGMWHMLYRAIWRLVGLWPVLSVLLLAVILPAIIDGLVTRSTKLDQFKPHNPVFFWGATHTAISTAGLFLFLPFLPVPLSVWMLYGVVLLVASSLWVTSSNLQTGN